ncbi:hypothetical protein NLI96_g8259 [Meripilus lineatus]|uniref:homogentisate 1,2-dioxygenase n=1 Tax=Meripilus lineatus TaxID=2056292 RepID=A0AAD5UXN7_9APHY|nr:hypothetical protein NLI96_g8259 [Physisporinus lineatus]
MGVSGASAKAGYSTAGPQDPYTYQVGFGNSFASEAIPGVLPVGQNSPQKCKYELYAEGPSVSHDGFTNPPQNPDLESDFSPRNPKVHITPTQVAWKPFDIPSGDKKVDFIEGIKTMAGTGGAVAHEGLASHVYVANSSMEKKAFVNSDGDMLIIPQQGRLDIQTELGRLFASPGEIVVVQSGIKFKVALPDGPSRGYIQELYGAHYELPELGPLGANGMANVRDFEHPVANFDVDQSNWEVVYKIAGETFTCHQDHTPFDVVAWHGNYVPYKYALEKFITAGSITRDHTDPSIFCVLTAKSKTPGIPLVDFCVLGPRWDVASHTFRPPYFHRNCATELIGFIKGDITSRADSWKAGGLSYHTNFCPHGVTATDHTRGTEMELVPMWVGEGVYVWLVETACTLMVTEFALQNKGFHEQDVGLWKGLGPKFLNHLEEANADLKAAGLAPLS